VQSMWYRQIAPRREASGGGGLSKKMSKGMFESRWVKKKASFVGLPTRKEKADAVSGKFVHARTKGASIEEFHKYGKT